MRCCVDPPWKCRKFRAGSIVNSQWQLFPAAQDYQPNTHLWSARRIRDSGALLSVALKRLCGGLACGSYRCARVIDLLGDRRWGVIKNDYCYCSIIWRRYLNLLSSLSKAPVRNTLTLTLTLTTRELRARTHPRTTRRAPLDRTWRGLD